MSSRQVTHRDLQALLGALADLYADHARATLPQRTLNALANLIAADITSFDCWESGAFSGESWRDTELDVTAEQLRILGDYAYQNPVFVETVIKRRTDAVKLTDFVSFNQFRNTTLYNEVYRSLGDADTQMAIALPVSSSLTVTCQMNRNRKDFSERDRTIVNLVAPHLTNAIRSAQVFERLNSALETRDSGVIAIDRAGKIQFASEFAVRLLEKYFRNEKAADNSLPPSLWVWIKLNDIPRTGFPAAYSPFKIKGAAGELIIRMQRNSQTTEKVLLLEERRTLTPKMLESLNITRRESQILFWMSQGKSDGDIAILCGISTLTVYKHAQNIYRKLGVETRTAAMLKALEVL